jgi:EAL and modified HD-GYP domain-containing signal transduction protein
MRVPITSRVSVAGQGSSVLVARQPICDADLKVQAYELLHRGDAVDGEQATAQVLLAACGDIGLGALVGARRAYVNVSRRFLLEVDPLPFEPELVVLELLEDQVIDDALVARLRELTAAGYVLALDDFAYGPEAEPLLRLASIVKVDVRAGDEGHPARQAELLKPYGVTLLAEKVEDDVEFERCRAAGYELFQGWFFCKPEIVSGREIPSASLAAIQAAASLSRPTVSFEEIEEVVSRDPGLSLRLLRLLNSASFSLRRRIETVHEAIVLLGAENVRQWGMLLALGGVKARCDELVPTALVRAQTLSLLAAQRGDDPDRAFAVGLLSVADALLGAPMEQALHDLPLAAPIVDALVRHAGEDGAALAAILAHERAERLVSASGGGQHALAACYLQALAWAQERATAAAAAL